jgi:hypothetical protein
LLKPRIFESVGYTSSEPGRLVACAGSGSDDRGPLYADTDVDHDHIVQARGLRIAPLTENVD